MSTITRLEERTQIARELEEREHLVATIKDREDVIAARKAIEDARAASDAARHEHDRVIDAARPSDEAFYDGLAERYPDLVIEGDEWPFALRCAVSGLPLFKGDVVISGQRDEYEAPVFVLASAVTVAPGVEVETTVLGSDA